MTVTVLNSYNFDLMRSIGRETFSVWVRSITFGIRADLHALGLSHGKGYLPLE